MESIIRDQLVKHMIKHDLFCGAQHRFVTGRSCMVWLVTALELWSDILDSDSPIDTKFSPG